ncbi:MAG: response regulator [Deltaproteobacteria bacterium]|nr:response regulator [Deltaproteobacteria bacterium]
MKILIVDDVRMSIEMGKSFLESSGCEVISAGNGQEGLERVINDHPDLVITDLHMPKMSGTDLCRSIKENPDLKDLPVVILTSDSNEENLEACHNAGCNGILKKPYNKSEIIESVRQYIKIICRKHNRASVDFDVFYNYNGINCSEKVTDISLGGMFVRSDRPPPIDSTISFSLLIEREMSEISVKGRVVRTVIGMNSSYYEEPGMGIMFESPPPELLSIISKLAGDGDKK